MYIMHKMVRKYKKYIDYNDQTWYNENRIATVLIFVGKSAWFAIYTIGFMEDNCSWEKRTMQ